MAFVRDMLNDALKADGIINEDELTAGRGDIIDTTGMEIRTSGPIERAPSPDAGDECDVSYVALPSNPLPPQNKPKPQVPATPKSTPNATPEDQKTALLDEASQKDAKREYPRKDIFLEQIRIIRMEFSNATDTVEKYREKIKYPMSEAFKAGAIIEDLIRNGRDCQSKDDFGFNGAMLDLITSISDPKKAQTLNAEWEQEKINIQKGKYKLACVKNDATSAKVLPTTGTFGASSRQAQVPVGEVVLQPAHRNPAKKM